MKSGRVSGPGFGVRSRVPGPGTDRRSPRDVDRGAYRRWDMLPIRSSPLRFPPDPGGGGGDGQPRGRRLENARRRRALRRALHY